MQQEVTISKKDCLELIAIFDAHHESFITETTPKESLQKLLSSKIGWLLDHKPEQFFSMMYRMDIPEQRIKEAVAGLYGNDVAWVIADLVITRFQEKLKLRKLYNQPSCAR